MNHWHCLMLLKFTWRQFHKRIYILLGRIVRSSYNYFLFYWWFSNHIIKSYHITSHTSLATLIIVQRHFVMLPFFSISFQITVHISTLCSRFKKRDVHWPVFCASWDCRNQSKVQLAQSWSTQKIVSVHVYCT